MNRSFGCVAAVLLVLTWGNGPARAQCPVALPPPPDDSHIVIIDGVRYVDGEYYLDSHADTAALAAVGGRDFEFQGRSVHGVIYRALLPLELERDSLPVQVSGVDYRDDERDFPALEPMEPKPDDITELLDLDRFTRSPLPYKVKHPHEIHGITKEDFLRMHKPDRESVWSSLLLVNPVIKKDPRITGTFRGLPIEDGPFHKPETITRNRDVRKTGNFIMPPGKPTGNIVTHTFNELYRGSSVPATGSFFSTSTTGRAADRHSIGVRGNWPVISTPSQYRDGIHGPRRR
jgi:hypothetical protein